MCFDTTCTTVVEEAAVGGVPGRNWALGEASHARGVLSGPMANQTFGDNYSTETKASSFE